MTTFELKLKEHELDINELNNLLNQASRENVKKVLKAQIATLNAEAERLRKLEADRIARLSVSNNSTSTTTTGTASYTKQIDSWGWDQSEKFVKIYITSLADLSKVKESDVSCNFTGRSFDLTVRNLNNVNHNLTINNLLNQIDPAASYFKCKTDMIAVFLRKVETNKSWSHVTEKEKKITEKSMPKMDENSDPQEGLMSMMKKMYEEGDDEMKRTISKAFTESREKSLKGETGLDGL